MRDTREFVRELAAENAAFWRDRDVRLDPDAPPSVRLAQIRSRMRQGVYNELRSVELLAAWIPYTAEREIRELLAGQLDDEHRHWQLLRARLIALGEDPDAYRPLPEWSSSSTGSSPAGRAPRSNVWPCSSSRARPRAVTASRR